MAGKYSSQIKRIQGREIHFLPLPSFYSKALRFGCCAVGLKQGGIVSVFGGEACFFFKSFFDMQDFIKYLRTMGFGSMTMKTSFVSFKGAVYCRVYVPILEIPYKKMIFKSLKQLSKKYRHVVSYSY